MHLIIFNKFHDNMIFFHEIRTLEVSLYEKAVLLLENIKVKYYFYRTYS